MIFRTLATAIIAATLAACGGGGSLYSDGSPDYYDFNYQPELNEPYEALAAGAELTLQARVVWEGPKGEPITTTQHVPMGFMQVVENAGVTNTKGEAIWTHGAGVYVGAQGLALELWSREAGGPTVGTFWSQDNGRCMMNTLGTEVGTNNCLDEAPNPVGYITPVDGFVLKKGTSYILTMYLREVSPGWMVLRAKLYQASSFDGVIQIQEAMVGFPKAQYLPRPDLPLRAAIARTPGEPVVNYEFLGDLISFNDKGRRLTAQEAKALL